MFAESPNAERYKAKDLTKAMERLFADGSLRMEAYGRSGDARKRIVRVMGEAADER
jgi:hypothetical protein